MSHVTDPHAVREPRLSTFVHNLGGRGGDRGFGFRCPDGVLHVFVCDVAGKGESADPAAQFLAQAVRMLVCQGMSLALAMECLDLGFRHFHGPEHAFASAFLANVDGSALQYVSAGHPDAYLVSPGGAHVHLGSTAPLLGISDGTSMRSRTVTTSTDDTLVVVTDGALDVSRGGVRLGESGWIGIVRESLRETTRVTAGAAAQRLFEVADRVADDVAILTLELSA